MRQPSSPSVTSRTAFIARAKAGDWKTAEQASFRFAEDQVGVGHPADAHHDHHDHSQGREKPR
jgi:hypothetical protein